MSTEDATNANPAPSKGRSKHPSLLACIPCRKSHLKCDGKKPLCSRCSEKNGDCIWINSRRGYREYRKNQSSPEDKTDQRPNNDTIFHESKPDVSQEAYPVFNEADTTKLRAMTYAELFQPTMDPAFPALPLELQTVPSAKEQLPSPSNSDSTMSISREMLPIPGDRALIESTDLIDLFYRHFYPSHPFIVPRKLYLQNPAILPAPLKACMRWLASHYIPQANHTALENAAKAIFSPEVPDDGFKVQGLLIYAMTCFARFGQGEGSMALDKAIEITLRIGLNRQSYALQQSPNDSTMQESWRRTWWTLLLIEGLVVVIGGQSSPFRLYSTYTDVALPGHDEDYNELRSPPITRTIADLRNRTFSEDTFEYSSFAYCIEAAYILGSVLALSPDTFAVTDPQVEGIDAAISNLLLSLPMDKREVVRNDGTIDECLLIAHLVIHWAAICLHRPRSTLTFIRNHYRTTCTKAEAAGLPALAYTSHTAKALRAANAITNLASIQTDVKMCSPVLMCGLTTAATVHLPAYAIVDTPDQAVAIKERLQLSISALGSFGEVWPRATIAKGQVAKFAREVLTKPNVYVDSTVPGMIPRVSEPVPQLEYQMPFNNESWMDNLIQAEQDIEAPSCPVFDTFAMAQTQGP
ncbi:uncharacterized protein PV07_09949 [Cladophialophora immunda]|uniref:Zn(2)-C6 fungal-type domain-containing protein n=1 Tax=Cladophialophora immunda TaxID=569365 RepID=A0A0D1Z981_9EURO|nr:uncharacterized protein PV07_09949 [Cladophialophora immunda]KIW24221.1 hypothetical protein PV07_09949 [Cladophialophora immunda]OQV07593.1 Fungal Zn2-Cys6 binuclear cluster domain-containing protein [Cladophialophora immunda]